MIITILLAISLLVFAYIGYKIKTESKKMIATQKKTVRELNDALDKSNDDWKKIHDDNDKFWKEYGR